jgi:hypothetical protein
MRWLVWTEGSQVLFIRLMEEWSKGFSKAATLWQNHNTGLWSQDSIIGNKEYFSEFMVYWTMNSTIVSASHKSVPMYSLSIGEAPVCPGTVWDLTIVSAEGRVPKRWWCLSGPYSAGLQYPRAMMQGSLPPDFKQLPYTLGPCREPLLKGRQWGKPLWGQGLHNCSVNPVQSDLRRKICRGDM